MYRKPFNPGFYGDDPRWFIGVVETPSADDSLGRVRVRVYGLHSNNMQDIDTYDLPLAQVMVPGTEEGTTGLGMNPQLEVGAMVFGFFLDGKSSQLPFVLGSFPRTEIADPAVGIDLGTRGVVDRTSFDPDSGESGAAPFSGSTPPAPGTTSERELQAMDYLVNELGYSPVEAAGIVGNLLHESTMNPNELNENDAGPGSDSFGLAQWNEGRLRELQAYARRTGSSVGDFNTQLEFIQLELNSTEARARRRLESATTPSEAALAFTYFERFQGYEQGASGAETRERMADAERIFNAWNSRN